MNFRGTIDRLLGAPTPSLRKGSFRIEFNDLQLKIRDESGGKEWEKRWGELVDALKAAWGSHFPGDNVKIGTPVMNSYPRPAKPPVIVVQTWLTSESGKSLPLNHRDPLWSKWVDVVNDVRKAGFFDVGVTESIRKPVEHDRP